MRTPRIALLLAVGLAMGSEAAASPFAFATDTNQDLYSIDLTTATATFIGNTGVFFESVALSAGGVLYGASSAGEFYTIDTGTGVATFVGNTTLGNVEGLDFNGSTLLATNFSTTPSVYSIDPGSAAASLVVNFGTATGVVRAMAVKDANTIIVRTDGPANNSLHTVDLSTGTTTLVGTIPGVDLLPGMDYFGSVLYGLDGSGNVYVIDDSDASTTLVGDTGGQFWLSMATYDSEPVPEPGTLALLALGLGGLAAKRRRAV